MNTYSSTMLLLDALAKSYNLTLLMLIRPGDTGSLVVLGLTNQLLSAQAQPQVTLYR
jgi:hypothetical protein